MSSKSQESDPLERDASCDVVVCVHNSLAVVRPCLESVAAHTAYPYRLVLVNDASDARTSEFLRSFLRVLQGPSLLLENPERLGFLGSCNRVLEKNEAPFTLLLNSDTVVTPGWLEKMIRCARSDPRIGLVTPLSNYAANLSLPMPPGLDCFQTARLVEAISPRRYPDAATAHGFCLLFTQKVLAELGGFDPAYGEGYGEETDFHMRATERGFRSVIADDTYVFHVGRSSYGAERREAIFKLNRERFMARWEPAYRAQLEKFEREDPLLPIREALHPPGGVDWSGTLLRLWVRGREYLSKYGLRGVPGKAWGYFSRHGLERRPGPKAAEQPARSPAPSPLSSRRPLRVTYCLPTLDLYGGVTSVVQLVNEMIRLGVEARIAAVVDLKQQRLHLPALCEPLVFGHPRGLKKFLPPTDVLVATFWITAEWVREHVRRHPEAAPAYFLQDYEPWFYEESDPLRQAVVDSYGLIPNRIVKSRWLSEQVARHGHASRIIPLGLNLDVYYRREVPRPARMRLLAMARPRTPRRGFPELMGVLGRIKAERPGTEVVLFGAFESREVPFEHTAAGLVESPDEMARLYSSADIFLDLSRFQGFGRPGLEAMACGTVPLLTSLGGLTAYARDGENCLLVPPRDEEAALAALRRLLDDEPLRRRLAEAGPASAQPFCHRREARETVAYFESLVEQGAGARA